MRRRLSIFWYLLTHWPVALEEWEAQLEARQKQLEEQEDKLKKKLRKKGLHSAD